MERLDTSFFIDEYTVDPSFEPKFSKDYAQLRQDLNGYGFAQDIKYSNVGYKQGKLVLLDYGYTGGISDCYLGN